MQVIYSNKRKKIQLTNQNYYVAKMMNVNPLISLNMFSLYIQERYKLSLI